MRKIVNSFLCAMKLFSDCPAKVCHFLQSAKYICQKSAILIKIPPLGYIS